MNQATDADTAFDIQVVRRVLSPPTDNETFCPTTPSPHEDGSAIFSMKQLKGKNMTDQIHHEDHSESSDDSCSHQSNDSDNDEPERDIIRRDILLKENQSHTIIKISKNVDSEEYDRDRNASEESEDEEEEDENGSKSSIGSTEENMNRSYHIGGKTMIPQGTNVAQKSFLVSTSSFDEIESNNSSINSGTSSSSSSSDDSSQSPPIDVVESNSNHNYDDDSSVSDDESSQSTCSDESDQEDPTEDDDDSKENHSSGNCIKYSSDMELSRDHGSGEESHNDDERQNNEESDSNDASDDDDQSQSGDEISVDQEIVQQNESRKVGKELSLFSRNDSSAGIDNLDHALREDNDVEDFVGTSETYVDENPPEFNQYEISLGDLKDIINSSERSRTSTFESDLDFSEAGEEDSVSLPKSAKYDHSQEALCGDSIRNIVLSAIDMKFWSQETLSSVTTLMLQENKNNSDNQRKPEYPMFIPPPENCSFWLDTILAKISTYAYQRLKCSNLSLDDESKQIREVFHSHLCCLDLALFDTISCLDIVSHNVNGLHTNDSEQQNIYTSLSKGSKRHIFIGNIQACESRLALAALQIKHIIVISSLPVKKLWIDDGVEYSIHSIPSIQQVKSSSACRIIGKAMKKVSSIIESKKNGSILVACETGNEHSCAVCTMYMVQRFGLSSSTALEKMYQVRPTTSVDISWIEEILRMLESEEDKCDDYEACYKTKPKRVLSCQLLSNITKTTSNPEELSPKRMRGNVQWFDMKETKQQSNSKVRYPILPILSLGSPAKADEQNTQVFSMLRDENFLDRGNLSPLEKQLSIELEESTPSQEIECYPVPLLTPPPSPSKELCKWPGDPESGGSVNPRLDTASSSAHKPDKLNSDYDLSSPSLIISPKPSRNVHSGLTPKLSGISIKLNDL